MLDKQRKPLPAWYRPYNERTLKEQHTCPHCKLTLPASQFVRFSDKMDFADENYNHNARKKVIDVRRCKACRARDYSRAYAIGLREQIAAERNAIYEATLKRGEEITDIALIPREHLPAPVKTTKGVDPVLDFCMQARGVSVEKRTAASVKYHAILVTSGNWEREGIEPGANHPQGIDTAGHPDCIPALLALKWQIRLYQARIAVVEEIRRQRKHDLAHPATAHDPLRLDWRHYVTPEMKAPLVRIAAKANQYRFNPDPSKAVRGRPFKWMPELTYRVRSKNNDDAPSTAVVKQQWYIYRAQAQHTLAKSTQYLRVRLHELRKRKTWTVHGEDTYKFTMQEFHELRMKLARDAITAIDAAISAGRPPGAFYGQYEEIESARVITAWEQLVDKDQRARIVEMWGALDETTRYRMQPFSRKYKEQVKRNRFQVKHNLDHRNVRLPPPAPAFT